MAADTRSWRFRRTTRTPEQYRGLLLIALFKLGKAALFFTIGVGALHFLHKDLSDALLEAARQFRFDPESHFITVMLAQVDLIDTHRLKEISIATFGYSALALTEGVGLMLKQTWAEYLTLFLGVAFLPWELYELARRVDVWRVSILLINIAVVWYLLWLLRRMKVIGKLDSI